MFENTFNNVTEQLINHIEVVAAYITETAEAAALITNTISNRVIRKKKSHR